MPLPLARSLELDLLIVAIDLLFIVSLVALIREAGRRFCSFRVLGGLTVLLIVAGGYLLRLPVAVSDLPVSDALEYSVAAHRYLFEGSYSLGIGPDSLPPRYAPGFSLLTIVPAYLLVGPEIGNAIWPVTFFAILALLLSFYSAALMTGSVLVGYLAIFCLLLVPEFRQQAIVPMTDLPALTLLLAAILQGILISQRPSLSLWPFRRVGLFLALAILFRSTNVILCLAIVPILWRAVTARPRALFALLMPVLLAICSHLLYNTLVFEDPFRTGYNFWVPIPYDYLGLTFSARYIIPNLLLMVSHASWLGLGVILLTVMSYNSLHGVGLNPQTRPLLWAALFLFLGLCTLFLPYFFPAIRFFLPISALLALCSAIELGRMLPRPYLVAIIGAASFIVLGSAAYRFFSVTDLPLRRLAAERIKTLPTAGIVVAGLDPVYAERMAGPNGRSGYLPISRRLEFASKMVAPQGVSERMPQPSTWFPHRTEKLRQAGGIDPVPAVALEDLSLLHHYLMAGRRVFIEDSLLEPNERAALGASFSMQTSGPHLWELTP